VNNERVGELTLWLTAVLWWLVR